MKQLTVVGKYRLLRELGVGRSGTTYLAVFGPNQQMRAAKQLHPAALSDPDVADELLQRVRLARHISHPHISNIVDLIEVEGAIYVIFEFIEGPSLSEFVTQLDRHNLPEPVVVQIAWQICQGLDFAHHTSRNGRPELLTHGSLWPQNIFFDWTGMARIRDFGSVFAPERNPQSATARFRELFLAPELTNPRGASVRGDVYAVGQLLTCLLSDRQAGIRPGSIVTSDEQETTHISDGLRAVIERCIAADPTGRYDDIASLTAALAAACPLGIGRESRVALTQLLDQLARETPSRGGPAIIRRSQFDSQPAQSNSRNSEPPLRYASANKKVRADPPTIPWGAGSPFAQSEIAANTETSASSPDQEDSPKGARPSVERVPLPNSAHSTRGTATQSGPSEEYQNQSVPSIPPPLPPLGGDEEDELTELIDDDIAESFSATPDEISEFDDEDEDDSTVLESGEDVISAHTRRVRRLALMTAAASFTLMAGIGTWIVLSQKRHHPKTAPPKAPSRELPSVTVGPDAAQRAPQPVKDAHVEPLKQTRDSSLAHDVASSASLADVSVDDTIHRSDRETKPPKKRAKRLRRRRFRLRSRPRSIAYVGTRRLGRTPLTKKLRIRQGEPVTIRFVAARHEIERWTVTPTRRNTSATIRLKRIKPAKIPRRRRARLTILCSRRDRRRIFIDGRDTGRSCPRLTIAVRSGKKKVGLYDPKRDRVVQRVVRVRRRSRTVMRIPHPKKRRKRRKKRR